MLRFFCLCLAIALAQPALAQPRPDMSPQQAAHVLWDVMAMDALAPILRDEALAEGAEMASTMFPRGGTGRWMDRVAAIHAPDRIRALFLRGVLARLPAADPQDLHRGLAFYRTGLGRQLLSLETRARIAMLDDKVEAAARDAWAREQSKSTPRAARINRLIAAADLVEANVAGGLNASVAFAKGFQEGGGFPMPLSEGQIVADAWAQEPQLRTDTEDWIGAYLFLAYAALSDAQLDLYIAYAASDGGRILSQMMFAGFDAAFTRTSHDMGRAAAAELRGRQL